MARKMTKQTRMMVEATNAYLRHNHIKDEMDEMFHITGYLLLRADAYHGFNYFTADGRLSGGNNENFDHLEYYIV